MKGYFCTFRATTYLMVDAWCLIYLLHILKNSFSDDYFKWYIQPSITNVTYILHNSLIYVLYNVLHNCSCQVTVIYVKPDLTFCPWDMCQMFHHTLEIFPTEDLLNPICPLQNQLLNSALTFFIILNFFLFNPKPFINLQT